MPNDSPASRVKPPTWPELLGLRPSVLTPRAVRHGMRGAAVLGATMAVIVAAMMSTTLLMAWLYAGQWLWATYALMGVGWLAAFAGPLVLAAGAAVLARSMHRCLWRDDEALRVAPISPAERLAGIQASALRLFGVAMVPAVVVKGLMLAGLMVAMRGGGDADGAWTLASFGVLATPALLGARAALFLHVFVATLGLRWATGHPGGARPWGLVAGVLVTYVVEFALRGLVPWAGYWLATRFTMNGGIALDSFMMLPLLVVTYLASALVWLWLARRAWARAEAVYGG